MKMKKQIVLFGSLLAVNLAMAADYTLATSPNLSGMFSVSDTGVNTVSGLQPVYTSGMPIMPTPVFDRNTVTVSTYQAGGSWFETTVTNTWYGYDYQMQSFTQDQRALSVSATGPISGSQYSFIDLSFNTTSPMSFSVSANGTPGSQTTPLGFTQSVSPSLGLLVDGVYGSGYSMPMGTSFWSGNAQGSVDNSFRAVVEAFANGTVTGLTVNLQGDKVLGDVSTQHYSYIYSTQTTQRSIPSPVPEPETYGMLLAGLGLMGAITRRRRTVKV